MNTQILQFNTDNLRLAAKEILDGGIVAFPTETVYGLGANALNPDAVKKIYIAKGRPSDNPLICHISDKSQIEKFAYLTPFAEKIIDAFMPGPITVILQKKPIVPDIVTGGLQTVGIRMPAHKGALSFIKACGVPICAPSANTSTKPSPTAATHVFDDLNGKIKYILDGGRCGVGLESTIVDCVNGTLLRQGGVPKEDIERIVGTLNPPPQSDIPLCPGMKYKHYSPNAEVLLAIPTADMRSRIAAEYDKRQGKTIILTLGGSYGNRNVCSVGSTVEEYAYNLFDCFRRLDDEGYECIICEGVDGSGVGAALMNRLNKASGGFVL
ncbi:MAG: threonylcarbamoyl-AMP synthase [Clostridia bacterium]|nr:threonylcarbamoyl-AMP synthase [Clostridia bacterium]